MGNLIIALNVVLPLFLIMLLGYFCKARSWFNTEFIKGANKLSFSLFLPILLFSNIYESDVQSFLDPQIIVFALGSIFLLVILSILIVPRLIHDPTHSSVIIQGLYRSNYVILGIPIVTNYYGQGNLGIISMLVAFVVPTFNILAVIIFEYFNPKMTSHHLKHLVYNILSNPLIIAGVMGLVFSLLELQLPSIIHSTIDSLSKMAIPLALLVLGADFELTNLSQNIKELCFCVFGRLIFVPMLMISIAILIGYRQVELLSLAVLYSAPISVSSYIMACASDADCDLAGQSVVFTTALSCITMVAIIACLTAMQLL